MISPGPGQRAREVDEDAFRLRVAPEQRDQHGARPAADVDDGADVVPPARELDVEVGDAVPGRPDELVEFSRDLRMGGQVCPERPPEHLLVGRLAGADVVEQRPPGTGHPAADALKIEEAPVCELLRGLVAGEPAGRFLGEHSLGDQVTEDGVQGVTVAAGRRGEFGYAGTARRDVFGDAQGRGHMEAPGSGQVQHLAEVHSAVSRSAGLASAGLGLGQAGLLVDTEGVAVGIVEPSEYLTGGRVHRPDDLTARSLHCSQGQFGIGHHDIDDETGLGGGRAAGDEGPAYPADGVVEGRGTVTSLPYLPPERLPVELGGAGHVHDGNLDIADLPRAP